MIRTLTNAQPPVRSDGIPWTAVRVEESATNAAGSYLARGTFNLTPVDADPANPALRAITFNSLLERGFFRLVFIDAALSESPPTDPTTDQEATTGLSWSPLIADVGALLRARTKDENGNELGTFSTLTRPTAAAVALIIEQAAGEVRSFVGSTVPAQLQGAAKHATALAAAMLIELSYYPEQIRSDRSAYPEYKARYDDLMEGLTGGAFAGPDFRPGGDGAAATPISGAQLPSYFFPKDEGGLIGWGTVF